VEKVLRQYEDGAPRGVGRLGYRVGHVAAGAEIAIVQAQPVRGLEARHENRRDERLVDRRVRDVGVERLLLVLEGGSFVACA